MKPRDPIFEKDETYVNHKCEVRSRGIKIFCIPRHNDGANHVHILVNKAYAAKQSEEQQHNQ